MAYGNVLGYTPAPQPGAYNFHQANGQSVLLSGPPAESLKARLDASAGLAGQRVAGPGGGAQGIPANSVMAGSGALNDAPAPAPAAPAAPAMSVAPAPPPMVSMAPREGAAPPAPDAHAMALELTGGGVAPGAAPGPVAPAAPMGPQPISAGGINTGELLSPDGRLLVPVAPTAAVKRSDLLAKADLNGPQGGVMMPHSASETVSGGFTPSTDYLERRADLAIDKRLAIDKASDAEADAAVREKQLADQQFADAAALKAEEQARTNQITQQVQKDLETRDRLQKDYGNAKVDPTRIFAGKAGTWRAIGAALAAGLGAAGSGMQAAGGHPGAPNIGYQAVQSAIDRDIAAQENEIKVKGEQANNALSAWIRSGNSLEQAKLGLKGAQLQWTAAQIAQTAALTKGAMVEPNRELLHNQVLSALNDTNEDYRQRAIGTRTQQVASQVVYPHAGSAGGYRMGTPGEAYQAATRGTELGTKGVELEQKKYNLAHPKSPGLAKQQGLLADNQAAQQELLRAAAAAGLNYDEKTGALEGEGHGVIHEGFGSTEHTKNYVNALTGAAPLVLKAQGVSRVGTSEQEAWAKQGKSMSSEQNKKFLQSQLESLKAKERAIRAGGGGVAETEAAPAAAAPAEGEVTE